MGVDLFFVLSGFLISGLLFKEYEETGDFHLWRFLARRGLKIYPSYYVFLLLSLPAVIWIPGLVNIYSLGCEVLFLSNTFFNIWGHTWSLCIEEHFYLILAFGFMIATRSKQRFKFFMPACVLFLLLPLAFRFNLISRIPFHEKPHLTATAVRLDALTFGVLLSYLCFYKPQIKNIVKRFRWLLIVLGVLLILPCATGGYHDFLLYTFGISLVYMGWGLLLLVALSHEAQTKNKLILLLARMGMYSYCIYLWHKPFAGLCSLPSAWWPGNPSSPLLLGIYFAGSLLVGILMSIGIEWPVLRLRDRFVPARTAPETAQPATN